MTKEEFKSIRNKFREELAEITLNRRYTKAELQKHFSQEMEDRKYQDWEKITNDKFYCSKFMARHFMLAYAFFKGTPYNKAEAKTEQKPAVSTVVRILERLGVSKPEQYGETYRTVYNYLYTDTEGKEL